MKLISIVVPVYNEEANVVPLYEAVVRAIAPIGEKYDWEFVFTDNCSTDFTFERIQQLAARDPRVRGYRFSRNFGFQRSILTGYRLARGDAAIQIDCDLQDPPELILDFVNLWEAGYKIVYGVRRSRPDSMYVHAMRRLFYRLIAWLSTDNLPYDAGDFRLVDRCVLELLHQYRDENPYLRGYIATLGYRQIGVDYDRGERLRGKSAFTFGSLLNLAFDGIVSHSILPLRLASIVGIAAAGFALAMILTYFILWASVHESWPRGFMTLAILVLLSLALNAIFLGIIGEYLARIYRQVNPRPVAIVEEFVDHPGTAEPAADGRKVRPATGVVLPLRENAERDRSPAEGV
jgi:glycosyltransferase involved in cell wall biosynthesis